MTEGPRLRWYDNPILWLVVQLAELAALLVVLALILPAAPSAVERVLTIVLVLAVFVANYGWRRRLRARDESS